MHDTYDGYLFILDMRSLLHSFIAFSQMVLYEGLYLQQDWLMN